METQNEVFNRMLYYIAISQIFESHLIYFQNLNRWYWKCFRWNHNRWNHLLLWCTMSLLEPGSICAHLLSCSCLFYGRKKDFIMVIWGLHFHFRV